MNSQDATQNSLSHVAWEYSKAVMGRLAKQITIHFVNQQLCVCVLDFTLTLPSSTNWVP